MIGFILVGVLLRRDVISDRKRMIMSSSNKASVWIAEAKLLICLQVRFRVTSKIVK